MADKLFWINHSFISKDQYAPYVIQNDSDYYPDLMIRYKRFLQEAVKAGADQESVKIITGYQKKILEAIRNYYQGKISSSHQKIRNLVAKCIDHRIAVANINDSFAFPGDKNLELQLFRARLSEVNAEYSATDMLHIPFDLRGLSKNYRFSISGVPCWYLANSSYGCWIEMEKPADQCFNVSPVLLDGEQRVFNLAVMSRDMTYLNDFDASTVHCWLKLMMLMMATSYRIKESNRTFKSEYIISQAIMLACKDLKLDGVAYYSKRVDDEIFAVPAVNLALFAPYKYRAKYADICNHAKVGDPFNYATFKQLTEKYRSFTNDMRLDHVSRSNGIGTYSHQYDYHETVFCQFNHFLFHEWKDRLG